MGLLHSSRNISRERNVSTGCWRLKEFVKYEDGFLFCFGFCFCLEDFVTKNFEEENNAMKGIVWVGVQIISIFHVP